MKLIALSLASMFLLTGCSSLLGDESDAAACEKLATVVSTENVSLDTFSPTEVAAKLRSEIGVRCALSGVNFDFSVIGNLIK